MPAVDTVTDDGRKSSCQRGSIRNWKNCSFLLLDSGQTEGVQPSEVMSPAGYGKHLEKEAEVISPEPEKRSENDYKAACSYTKESKEAAEAPKMN